MCTLVFLVAVILYRMCPTQVSSVSIVMMSDTRNRDSEKNKRRMGMENLCTTVTYIIWFTESLFERVRIYDNMQLKFHIKRRQMGCCFGIFNCPKDCQHHAEFIDSQANGHIASSENSETEERKCGINKSQDQGCMQCPQSELILITCHYGQKRNVDSLKQKFWAGAGDE